jgi:hypothetical protein
VVLVPRYRRGVFTDEIPRRCKEIMRDVCADFHSELRELEHPYVNLPGLKDSVGKSAKRL